MSFFGRGMNEWNRSALSPRPVPEFVRTLPKGLVYRDVSQGVMLTYVVYRWKDATKVTSLSATLSRIRGCQETDTRLELA